MRTKRIKLYSFEELTNEAKQNAISKERNNRYEYNDFAEWALDDCSLLEPNGKELTKLFGKDYKFPLLENNRKIYFSLDRGRYIDISNALEIQNSRQFLKWLGLNDRLIEKVDYSIGTDTIEISNQSHLEFTEIEQGKIDKAIEKFEDHCNDILNRIENSIDYRFTDECIKEDLIANEYEFLKDGTQY